MGLPLSGGDSGPPGLVLNFGILGSHAGACEDACCSAPAPDAEGLEWGLRPCITTKLWSGAAASDL